jgi:hypothetical protein
VKEPWRTPSLKEIRTSRLSREEIRKIRRDNVTDAQALKVVKAQRAYGAQLRSGWDAYGGAIAAAYAGDAGRLVDLLRAGRQLTTEDCEQVTGFIGAKRRRRTWPTWLEPALKSPTEDDHDRLADLVEQIGRRRGAATDEPAHRAAKLVHALIDIGLQRDVAIERACEMTEDQERCRRLDRERVRNLLDHPRARMNEPRRPKKQ